MRISPASRASTSGYTLTELLVVLAVMSMVIGIAVPTVVSQRQGYLFREEASSILEILTRARNEARVSARPARLMVENGSLLSENGEEWKSSDADLRLSYSPALPARDENMLVFFPDGSSSGGRLMLGAGERELEWHIGPWDGRIALATQPEE